MKRFSLSEYLHETGVGVLAVTVGCVLLYLAPWILMSLFAVGAWAFGAPDWGYFWQYSLWSAIFFGGMWAVAVPCIAIATIPAVPRTGRRLRAGIRRTKDRLLRRRRTAGGNAANLRDLAALGSLGRAGRSAVHRALRPPPPPIWPAKPRWLGLTVRCIRLFGRGFFPMLWKSVCFLVAFAVAWQTVLIDILPEGWALNIIVWAGIPAVLLVSVCIGILKVRYPYHYDDEPVLLVGAVKPLDGVPAGQAPGDGTKEEVVRAHYDRPSRKEIEVDVRSALELHADGSMSPCHKLRGAKKVRCTPAKGRSVLDLEQVVLICQREAFSELSLVDRFAYFAARHRVDQ